MGKINEYQRRQLASSVTNAPRQSQAGSIIGSAVSTFGVAMKQRQDALDNAQAMKAYNGFVVKDAIQSAQLQKQYMTDPNVDPLTFHQEYTSRAEVISQGIKESLPSRVGLKFDKLISHHQVQQSVKNTNWVMNLQNRNALEGFAELGTGASLIASQTFDVSGFMDIVSEYKESALTYRPLVTPASYSAKTKAQKSSIAKSHMLARLDFENGGNPVKFWSDLETNKEYANTLKKMIGTQDFNKITKSMDKSFKNMGVSLGFKKLMSDDEKAIDLTNKIFSQESGFGLSDMQNLYQMEKNTLAQLKASNIKGVNDQVIEQSQTAVNLYSDLVKIASNVNDSLYQTDEVVKMELITDIKNTLSPFSSGDKKETVLQMGADVVTKQKNAGGLGVYELANPIGSLFPISTVANYVLDRAGVPMFKSGSKEGKENIKAGATISEYMKSLYEIKGKILSARAQGKLTNKDAQLLVAKFTGPLSTANNYDRVTSYGRNWFTDGYNAFGRYTHSMMVYGSDQERRITRDKLQSQMMTRLATWVDELDIEPSEEMVQGMIASIKNAMNMRRSPAFAGAKPGDYVNSNGRAVKFVGFDNDSGEPIVETPEGLQEAVNNL